MPRPNPRHRRKAGSGPPAAALIAWIGTHNRQSSNAAATAVGVRPELRPPASTRPARNVAASVALLCGAVLAVAATTTQGVLGPHDAATTPVIPQARPGLAAPNQTAPNLAEPPVPAKQVDQSMAFVPAPPPAAARPAVVRQAPRSIPVPPAAATAAKPAAVPPAARPPVTVPRTAPRAKAQPDTPAQRRSTSTPDGTRTSHSDQRSASSSRGSRSGGLGPTVNRTAESLGSTLGLR